MIIARAKLVSDRLRRIAGVRGSFRYQLVSAAAGTAGLQVANIFLTSTSAIVLARILRPEGYGIYVFAMALVTMLGLPSQVGMPTLVMREVARFHVQERWGELNGLLRRSNQIVISMAVVTAALTAWLGWAVKGRYAHGEIATLLMGMPLLPLIALGAVRSSALRGLSRIVASQVPEMLLRPALTLSFIGGVALVSGAATVDAVTAMSLNVVATLLAFVAGTILLLRELPPVVRQSTPMYNTRIWLRSVIPLSLLGGTQLISSQTDILMLGLLRTPAEVGVYRVAVQVASFVMMSAVVLNSVLAPHIARLHAQDDIARLHRLAQRGAYILFITALIVGGGLIVFGRTALALVFGPDYVQGYVPLVILSIGSVIAAEQGSLVTVMNMTGNEQSTAKVMAVGAGVNILLNALTIPFLGMIGAAVSTVLSTLLWRALLIRQLRATVGIRIGAVRQMFYLP